MEARGVALRRFVETYVCYSFYVTPNTPETPKMPVGGTRRVQEISFREELPACPQDGQTPKLATDLRRLRRFRELPNRPVDETRFQPARGSGSRNDRNFKRLTIKRATKKHRSEVPNLVSTNVPSFEQFSAVPATSARSAKWAISSCLPVLDRQGGLVPGTANFRAAPPDSLGASFPGSETASMYEGRFGRRGGLIMEDQKRCWIEPHQVVLVEFTRSSFVLR